MIKIPETEEEVKVFPKRKKLIIRVKALLGIEPIRNISIDALLETRKYSTLLRNLLTTYPHPSQPKFRERSEVPRKQTRLRREVQRVS